MIFVINILILFNLFPAKKYEPVSHNYQTPIIYLICLYFCKNDDRSREFNRIYKHIIMQLEKQHREALITELNKVREELNLAYQIDFRDKTEDFQKWSDIKKFLLNKRIELIEESLISNEIDF